jgi:hypothetical protein
LIGGFIPDAIRNITGVVGGVSNDNLSSGAFYVSGLSAIKAVAGSSFDFAVCYMDASRAVPTALETRGASVSVFACVTY